MSASIKLLYIEEAWRLAIAKGRSYNKLDMMAFANKIQTQTQLSLKLLYSGFVPRSDKKHKCTIV